MAVRNTKANKRCRSKEGVNRSPSPSLSKRTKTSMSASASAGILSFVPIPILVILGLLLLFAVIINDGIASAFSPTTTITGKAGSGAFSKQPPARISCSSTSLLRSASVNAPSLTKIMFEAKSCPPPRFDDFSEQLIGKWITETAYTGTANDDSDGNSDNDNDNKNDNKNDNDNTRGSVVEVEEVMRSCGGAVQGIREPTIQHYSGCGDGDGDGSSVYLNRANDGFVYFNDGSYSMGPVTISGGGDDDSDSDDPNEFLSCLVLPALVVDGDEPGQLNPKRRMVAFFATHKGIIAKKEQPNTYRVAMRTKAKFFGGDASSATPGVVGNERTESADDSGKYSRGIPMVDNITNVICCRMPSEGQPWMLQRAKWENLLPTSSPFIDTDGSPRNEDGTGAMSGEEDGEDTPAEASATLRHWVISESAAEFYHRIGIETESTSDSADERSTIIHCGVACMATNTLHMVARQYNSNSGRTASNSPVHLSRVLYVEGMIRG
eukprot:jgi/Psemu1/27974/gm1.27974_g